MKAITKTVLGILAVTALVAVFVVVRTSTYRPTAAPLAIQVQLADALPIERARAATAGLDVTVEWERPPYESSPVSSITSRSWQILSAIAANGGEWPVAPGLVTATTDSRSLTGVAPDIYRFQAIVASLRELAMIHGTNERLTLDNLARMPSFYTRLIVTAAR
jgi:carboxypeptidase PM20D1